MGDRATAAASTPRDPMLAPTKHSVPACSTGRLCRSTLLRGPSQPTRRSVPVRGRGAGRPQAGIRGAEARNRGSLTSVGRHRGERVADHRRGQRAACSSARSELLRSAQTSRADPRVRRVRRRSGADAHRADPGHSERSSRSGQDDAGGHRPLSRSMKHSRRCHWPG